MAVMMLRGSRRLAVSVALFLAIVILSYPAFAENRRATTMWGIASDGSASSAKSRSSEFHASGRIIPGQVNAARLGVLYSGPNMTVVGSQTVLQAMAGDEDERDVSESRRTQLVLPPSGPAVLCNELRPSDDFDPTLKDIRNDQNASLASEDNPAAGGLRFIASISQLRLGREDGPALEIYRLGSVSSGSVSEFRRSGALVGNIDAFPFGTRYTVTSDGLWHGMAFPTAARPTVTHAGFHGFDTTLGVPVWWHGSNWVDATGVTV